MIFHCIESVMPFVSWTWACVYGVVYKIERETLSILLGDLFLREKSEPEVRHKSLLLISAVFLMTFAVNRIPYNYFRLFYEWRNQRKSNLCVYNSKWLAFWNGELSVLISGKDVLTFIPESSTRVLQIWIVCLFVSTLFVCLWVLVYFAADSRTIWPI